MTKPKINVKRITQPFSNPTLGSFAHVTQESGEGNLTYGEFVFCRETFQNSVGDWRQILFVHPAEKGAEVAAFFAKFETKMDHDNLSECGPTNNNQISWIKPAEFWTRNSMRKSLLTAILRASIGHNGGIAYDLKKDNFDESLYGISFLKNTRPAVELFLAGHTWAKTHAQAGWYNTFANQTTEQARKTLGLKPIAQGALLKFAAEQLGCDTIELAKRYRQNRDKQKREQRLKEKEAGKSGEVIKK